MLNCPVFYAQIYQQCCKKFKHVVRVLNVYGDDADRTGIPFPPLQSMLWNEKKGGKKVYNIFW